MVCGVTPTDLHHIKTRGSGGSDDLFNLINLCRYHHQQVHSYGMVKFINNHKHIMGILHSKGWEIQNVLGKRVLVRYAKD